LECHDQIGHSRKDIKHGKDALTMQCKKWNGNNLKNEMENEILRNYFYFAKNDFFTENSQK